MNVRFHLWFLALLCTRCVSFDHGSQTARTVSPGEKTYGGFYHIGFDHEKTPLSLRKNGSFGTNLSRARLDSGFSVAVRYGLKPHLDTGIRVNAENLLFDLKYASFGGERWKVGTGISLTTPTFSLLSPETYYPGLPAYFSYDITSNAIYYLNALYLYLPTRDHHQDVWGVSTGLILGTTEGLLLGYDLYTNTKTQAGYEQYKIGWMRGLDHLDGRKELPPAQWLRILAEVGSILAPYPCLGVTAQLPLLSKGPFLPELSWSQGMGPLPGSTEGYASPSLLSAGGVLSLTPQYGISLALARSQLFYTANTDSGWITDSSYNHGFSVGFRQTWTHASLDWLGLYVPLGFLPKREPTAAPNPLSVLHQTGLHLQIARYKISL